MPVPQPITFQGSGGAIVSSNVLTSGLTLEPAQLEGNWVNYSNASGSFQQARYGKRADGLVVLEGLVRNGTNGTIFTLPERYRPREQLVFSQKTDTGSVRVDVRADGNVSLIQSIGASDWLSLSGISFRSNQSFVDGAHEVQLEGSWVNFNSGFEQAQYSRTQDGLMIVEGMVRNGTNGTILTLPEEYRPEGVLIFAQRTDDGLIRVNVRGDGLVDVTGSVGSADWVSLSGISFRLTQSFVDGAYPAELEGSWINYSADEGSFEQAQYSKTQDGLIVLEGLVRNGVSGTIFTLPEGFRPAQTNVFDQLTGPNSARIDVSSDGSVNLIGSIGALGWLSLSGISFIAA